MYLLKIAFPYWSNVCFGCDWHILTSELALLSVSQKDENPALFPVISIRCRLAHRPIPFLLLGSLGIGKRCFESRNNNTCSNPFIDGFLVLSKAQQGVLRVTRRLFGYCRKVAAARYVLSYSKPFGLLPESLAASCSSEVGQPEYRKRGYRFIPHILFACFSEKHLIPSWLANATTLLPREPVRKEQLLLPSPSISSEYS